MIGQATAFAGKYAPQIISTIKAAASKAGATKLGQQATAAATKLGSTQVGQKATAAATKLGQQATAVGKKAVMLERSSVLIFLVHKLLKKVLHSLVRWELKEL